MKKKPLTIGFAGIADFRSIIGQEIVSGINSAARDFNINLVNFIGVIRYSLAEDIESYYYYKKKLKFLNEKNIDGLISWTSSFQYFMPKAEIAAFHQTLLPLPLVSIGLSLENIPSILIDNYSGINELLTHLINVHGYSKIAFIGSKGKAYYEERLAAYRQVLEENNIRYNPELVYILKEIESGREIRQCLHCFFQERKLCLKKDIEAIVTVSDLVSQQLVDELAGSGIQVPGELAVVGFNNQLGSIRSFPPLTTIDPHFFQIGYQAVVSLLSVINGNKNCKNLFVPCRLIVRQSCGCFEDLITRAEIKQFINTDNRSFDLLIKEHYEKIIASLTSLIHQFDAQFQVTHAHELLDSFTNDIMSSSTCRFLNAIRKYIFNYKKVPEERLISWQNVISDIRNLLIPYFSGSHNILQCAENIFHQTRVMIDVANSYLAYSRKGDVYKTGGLVRIAADFGNVEDLDMIRKLLKVHINELEIPGIYLALHDQPRGEPGKCCPVFAYTREGEMETDNRGNVIPAYRLVSREILPADRRFSLIFEILYYKELFLGFVLFEMGPQDIPLYDSLRTILSPALYRAMSKNPQPEPENEKRLLFHDLPFKDPSPAAGMDYSRGKTFAQPGLNTHTILDYLYRHINEPTDLVKIAGDLNLSMPTLIRKTKQFTGYSIQKLHEILKIEKAKSMLENKIFNISEIAERLGYRNQFYFSSVFKKHLGMSPRKWLESKSK